MRVLLVSGMLPPLAVGGAESVAAAHAEMLRANGHDVFTLSTTGVARLSARTTITRGSSQHFSLIANNVYHTVARDERRWMHVAWHSLELWNPGMRRALSELVMRLRPDVLLAENLWNLSTAWLGPVSRELPVGLFLHDAALFCASGLLVHPLGVPCQGRGACRVVRRVRRRQSRHVAGVAAPSEFFLKASMRAGVAPNAVRRLIQNVPVREHQPAGARAATDQPPGRKLLYVGQLEAHKGVALLRRVAETLDTDQTLTVVGAGRSPSFWGLEDLITKGRVQVMGRLGGDQVRAEMARADLLLFPSLWPENAPLVLLEAARSALPVLAFDTPGVRETAARGGVILVPAYDVEGFIGAVREVSSTGGALLRELRDNLIRGAAAASGLTWAEVSFALSDWLTEIGSVSV